MSLWLRMVLVVAAMAWGSMAAFAQGYLGDPRAEYRLLFIGDKMGGGLWSGALRMSKQDARIKIAGRYKEDSGLARVKNYSWAAALPKIFEAKLPDIVVVMIGMNDSRAIRDNGNEVPFGSDEWKQLYRAHIDELIAVMKAQKVAVYWMGLPPVRNAKYDIEMQIAAKVQRDAVNEAGFRYIDIRKDFLGVDGTYNENGKGIEGNVERLRSRNGVTLIIPGNNKLAKMVLDIIHKDIDVADGERRPEEAPVPDAAKPELAALAYNGPLIGQMGAADKPIFYQPAGLPLDVTHQVARMPVAAIGQTARVVMENLEKTAAKDSTAAVLFSSGKWPQPPNGRIDDFTTPIDAPPLGQVAQ